MPRSVKTIEISIQGTNWGTYLERCYMETLYRQMSSANDGSKGQPNCEKLS